MMSASEGGGGHGKADVVMVLYYISVPNADKGEGVQKADFEHCLWSAAHPSLGVWKQTRP